MQTRSEATTTGARPHWRNPDTWRRLAFMAGFVFAYGVAQSVLAAVIVGQGLFLLLGGAPNERLRALGGALARYLYQILLYLSFNSEQRPFPFVPWPTQTPPFAHD